MAPFVFHVSAKGPLLRFENILSGSLTNKRPKLSAIVQRLTSGNFRGSVHYLNRGDYFLAMVFNGGNGNFEVK